MEKKECKEKTLVSGATMQADKSQVNKWDKPTLEDVSGRVMAQPYIRFT